MVMDYEELHLPPVDDFDHEEIEVGYLFGSCQSGWRGSGMYFRTDPADLEKSAEKLRGEHNESCGCDDPFIGES
ncbi:MAG: hypothetical protein A2Z11_02075 [Candidatus Woykebacteria bacterium RBG_16_43_9]|uniref:Uncharacterized protein n=1 Tax=Candidatus Woykebacteria bacterium RBG_16_43_9 TaxID=1802596 RepID=A0A1G1WE09_9BACT|nr:MAG: hypothetical protein A2Z11_02075 [Candidatus Woykebacteria bacterium RBG_16_43_9]